ncbi:hypothetical protein [Thalassobacillus pellis]|uniref:hypothetical protein n=1 Tax=Thalassobacillus pellis TaxID=748008 RepID=UPI001960BD83|nr:hypothetical protein [Thalassobacillus pellis]MBM7552920.1 hypothetical protein [Thalassobacillus pellis]
MAKVVFPLVTMLLMVAGCTPGQKNIEVISTAPEGYEVYLFTDKQASEKQAAYLNAFLEFRNEYYGGSLDFKKRSPELVKLHEEVSQYPTLIILKNGKTITQISGHAEQGEVFQQLSSLVE